MQSFTFEEFFKSEFEPSDYAPNSTKLGTITFWSFFVLVAIFGS
jgi:hypothetical protein